MFKSTGIGLNEEELYKEAEKLLLVQDVDVVVAYAEDHLAAKLSKLRHLNCVLPRNSFVGNSRLAWLISTRTRKA